MQMSARCTQSLERKAALLSDTATLQWSETTNRPVGSVILCDGTHVRRSPVQLTAHTDWPGNCRRLALPVRMLYVIDTYAAETYMELIMTRLQTVVELPEFQRRAKAIMSDQEREAAINFIAANPEAGISLGGGLRKVRIPREGSGKSGGFRTVYVFGGTHMPIFLITVFAKNEKANLSKSEQAAAVEMSKALVAKYGDAT